VHRPSDNLRRGGRPAIGPFRAKAGLVLLAVCSVVLLGVLVARSPAAETFIGQAPGPKPGSPTSAIDAAVAASADIAARCPKLEAAIERHEPPAVLARSVVGHMTLAEKLGEIVLVETSENENINSGVARQCIPPLTLQDGPQGLAFGSVNVTQLPAPLGLAATFDPSLARAYGQVEGAEAAGQGIDVLQGPTLNIDRVPQNGRTYEGFGEDPTLVTAMGVATIEGIQSTGTLAMAKHFAVYNQETDRGVLNDVVPQRALQEIYLPPFKAAVTQAHVSTAMCAYPQLNGTFQCEDPQLLAVLSQWGFTGFVRSDLGSVHDPAAALAAGTDLIKPARSRALATLVHKHLLSVSVVDAAVTKVLTEMFAHGLVGRAPTGSPDNPVDSEQHTDFALLTAERSAVLLKDDHAILPLTAAKGRTIAVIGADAGPVPVTTGFGSSRVLAPFTSSPLAALRRRAGARVTFSDGGSTTSRLPAIPTAFLTPATGTGHGLTLTLSQTDGDVGRPFIQLNEPTADISLSPYPSVNRLFLGTFPVAPVERSRRSLPFRRRTFNLGPSVSPTRSRVVLPPGWSDVSASFTGTLTPPRTGLYTLSLQGSGASSLTLDGAPAVSDTLSHSLGRWSQTVSLVAGRPYRVHLQWEPVDKTTPTGETAVEPGTVTLGWQYVSDTIAAAVRAARHAGTAVVFAGDFNSEAYDRPSLSLPGDQNALIAAVAAANPRTVVVLNTGGPVLMPWVGKVAGIIEGWYPGEEDGHAISALLYGDVDPSGHLPVTFPATDAQGAANTPAQWPGTALTSTYSEGIDVGYRYDHALGLQPLFPFAYGLTYTRFALQSLQVHRTPTGIDVSVLVTNTGRRSGTEVPQAYLTDPVAAGEPPARLAAFTTVTLAPGRSRRVTMTVPASAFQAYLGTSWTTVPGVYTVSVGDSSSSLGLSSPVAAP